MTQEEYDGATLLHKILYDKTGMMAENHPDIIEVAEEYLQASLDILSKQGVSDSACYSEREVDFAYLTGVFNVAGIDGLQKEIGRLKSIGKDPHVIILSQRR